MILHTVIGEYDVLYGEKMPTDTYVYFTDSVAEEFKIPLSAPRSTDLKSYINPKYTAKRK